ncbi:MAG: NAD-dependent epimerase/dehydratase family protein [Betaproteobacteria bacterium]
MVVTASKVLVTGAGGFIGRALCADLARRGVAHVAAVRGGGDESDPARRALGDFAAADWEHALDGVDTIVHLAGRAHVTGRDHDPTPHIVANVHVTRRLLDAARRARVRRVVFASTVKVYGETTRPGRPFRAGDAAQPRDAYARSKAEAENLVWQACRDGDMEGVVLRWPLVYGEGVKGNFALLIEAVAGERRLPFAGVDNRRSLLYVGNAVTAIAAALEVPALAGQTLPVADARPVSTPELILKIAAALGVEARLSRMPTSVLRAGAALMGRRGASSRLLGSLEIDASRFAELARWTPSVGVDEGIAATIAWWRARHVL